MKLIPEREPDQPTRFFHRHLRRNRPSSAHIAEVVRPSPARAEPHDATAWLPLPDLDPTTTPPIEALLEPDPNIPAPAPRDLPVANPSPARAEPHDATAWLPLPDLDPTTTPPIEALLEPDPNIPAPAPRDLPVANPSPAHAEPHDATAWLPLPDLGPDADPATPIAAAPSSDGRRHGRVRRVLHRVHVAPRTALIITIVVALAGSALYLRANIFDQGSAVHIRVDGHTISAVSGVSSVASLLNEQKVTLGAHDRVVPALRSSLSDGMTVSVFRAFPITINLDGTNQTAYTTGAETATLMKELHFGALVVAVDAPNRISKTMTIKLRTKHSGTLSIDGANVKYDQPAATIRELLDQYNVVLGPADFTQPSLDSALTDDMTISVVRVASETQQAIEPYTVPDQTLPDPDLDIHKTRVPDAVPGTQRVTYQIVRNNGNIVARNPISKVPVQAATPKITYYGTKADWHWDKLAECETGGNWAAPGPTWGGGLGIYYKNWDYYGGKQYTPSAGQATREQQILIAEKIQAEHGWYAWGCAYANKLGWVPGQNPFTS